MFSFIRLLCWFVSANFRFYATPWFMDVQGVITIVGITKFVKFMGSGYRSSGYGAQRRIAT